MMNLMESIDYTNKIWRKNSMKKQVSILIMFIITLIVSTGCGTQKNINNSEQSEDKKKKLLM